MDEVEDGDQGFLALEGLEAEGRDSEEDVNNRQLVLHADFEDDDSEEDDDFVPGENDELDEDEEEEADAEGEEDESMDSEAEVQEDPTESATKSQNRGGENEDDNDSAIAEVSDGDTRTKIRKLHSAFPTVAYDRLQGRS